MSALSKVASNLRWAAGWGATLLAAAVILSAIGFLLSGGNPYRGESDLGAITYLELILAYAASAIAGTLLAALLRRLTTTRLGGALFAGVLLPVVYLVFFYVLPTESSREETVILLVAVVPVALWFGWTRFGRSSAG